MSVCVAASVSSGTSIYRLEPFPLTVFLDLIVPLLRRSFALIVDCLRRLLFSCDVPPAFPGLSSAFGNCFPVDIINVVLLLDLK